MSGRRCPTSQNTATMRATRFPEGRPAMASDSRARWTSLRAWRRALPIVCVLLFGAGAPLAFQDEKGEKKGKKETKRASLSLKANPPIAFSPANIVVTAELKGGSDTDE